MGRRITLTALLLAFLFFGTLSLRHYVFIPDEAVRPGFSPTESPEDLLTALRWYADSALGALHPSAVRALAVSSGASLASGLDGQTKPVTALLLYTKALSDRLQVFDNCVGGADAVDCRYPAIRQEFRSQVWWPGVPYDEHLFLYSPFVYEVTGVSTITESLLLDSPTLRVRFTWKVRGLSKLEQIALDLGLVQSIPLPANSGKQEVEFLSSKYGYFLPLTREPKPPTTKERPPQY